MSEITKTKSNILPPVFPNVSSRSLVSGTSIEQELYTKNAELDATNELLSVTRELYEVSLSSLDPVALADKIVTIMGGRLHLEMVGIFSFDREKDILIPLAFKKSERLHATLRQFGFLLRDIPITDATKRPAFKNIFNGKPFITTSAFDIWDGLMKPQEIETLSSSANLRTIISCPLLAEERIIGAVIIGYTSSYDQFSKVEKESLKTFSDIIAGALDKAFTYKELVVANRNLTEVNKEIKSADEKLKTIDETKSSILSFAQHYLQNPIENIVMASSMLADGSFGNKIEDMKEASVKMFESARHLSLTVKMWLKALDFEENHITYNMENFDFFDMINRISKDWVLIAQDRKIILSVETDGKSPYIIKADRAWIYDVVINLIDNAFKMTKEGFIKLKVEKFGTEKIRFSVADSGVGIDTETLSMLFQKFERGHAGWKNNVEGAGLGLYIAKKIIEDGHHGRIWVDSEGVGKGATFYVELPVS